MLTKMSVPYDICFSNTNIPGYNNFILYYMLLIVKSNYFIKQSTIITNNYIQKTTLTIVLEEISHISKKPLRVNHNGMLGR